MPQVRGHEAPGGAVSKDGAYVCAEIGVNWNDIEGLFGMCSNASSAGADAVKLQLFDEETLKDYPEPTKSACLARMLEPRAIKAISEMLHDNKTDLVITPMSKATAEWVRDNIRLFDGIKIRATDYMNQDIIGAFDGVHLPIYTSIPMFGEFGESEFGYNKEAYLKSRGGNRYRIMCLNRYPPRPADMNLAEVINFDGVSLHSPVWTDYLVAASVNLQRQVFAGTKRRFYIEAHVVPIGAEAEEVRMTYLDGGVSIPIRDLVKLVKAVGRLEDVIG